MNGVILVEGNYKTWSNLIMRELEEANLKHTIFSDYVTTINVVSEKDNTKSLRIIYKHLNEQTWEKVNDIDTVYDLWKYLKAYYCTDEDNLGNYEENIEVLIQEEKEEIINGNESKTNDIDTNKNDDISNSSSNKDNSNQDDVNQDDKKINNQENIKENTTSKSEYESLLIRKNKMKIREENNNNVENVENSICEGGAFNENVSGVESDVESTYDTSEEELVPLNVRKLNIKRKLNTVNTSSDNEDYQKNKSIERNLDNKTNEANYAETWNNLLEIVANDVFMPNTVQEALRSKYKKHWIIAINEKLGNYDTHKTIGYLIYVGCALICWKSKKKRKLTRSTTNTEYYSFIMDHIKENFINMSYLSPNNMLTDVLTTFERFIDNTFVY